MNFVLPADDKHFIGYAKRGYYQRVTYRAAKKHVRQFDVAVDVGAHIGFWTLEMCADFHRVWSFEPEPTNFVCLADNAPANAIPIRAALGAEPGAVCLVNPRPSNSGAWEATEGGDVPMLTLDGALPYGLKIGLLKIDVQGFEERVLKGAYRALESRPVVIVEVKGRNRETDESFQDLSGVEYLKALGAVVLEQCGKDWVMGWR